MQLIKYCLGKLNSTLYNFMTSSLALVSHEVAKIKIDRERPIAHTLWRSNTKTNANGLPITQYFIGSASFFGTVFKTLLEKSPHTPTRHSRLYRQTNGVFGATRHGSL